MKRAARFRPANMKRTSPPFPERALDYIARANGDLPVVPRKGRQNVRFRMSEKRDAPASPQN